MKYVKPTLEVAEIETSDIMLTSGGEGEITANGVTINGKKDEFAVDFSELTSNF